MKNMGFEKILVLGVGAIGSVVGSFLSEKYDTTLVGRKDHVEAVNSNGLKISGDLDKIFHVKADTEIREIPEKTLVILTTKAYDVRKAVQTIKPLLRKDTVILILQNGLGNEEAAKQVLGDEPSIVRGVTMIGAEFFEPGKIKLWQGKTFLGKAAFSNEIAEVFNDCSLETIVSDNIEREIWSKVVVNCVVNPLTALFKVRNSEIFTEALKSVRHQLVAECVAVASAEGVAMWPNLEALIEGVGSKSSNFSSMCQDLMKGKTTEIDFLNGKVATLGKKHGIPTPVNETLTSFIKFLGEINEHSRRD
jgi:2-dehydropantoate 2-reductase